MTLLTHCPICHARLTSESPLVTMLCYRCGSDLSMLFAIHQKAHHWLCLACYHFIHGRREQALECIKSALELSSSPLAHFFYSFIQQAKMDGVVLCDGRFG